MRQPFLTVKGRQTSIFDLLVGMTALRASDLYLKTGGPVRFKISGQVAAFASDRLTRDRMEHVLASFLSGEERLNLRDRHELDLVYETDTARYRVHFGYGQTGPYAAIRLIEQTILPLEKLGLPPAVAERLLGLGGGLMVLCGTTDAGKTVTCTSLLDAYNRSRKLAILTLEDPIEYVLTDKQSMVLQREIGHHTGSFASGLKSALRENVDVIFVGEMRGLETIEQVLKAAETGHMVISTLHADDVLAAISRMIGSFPPVEQPRIRQSLAGVLQGVLFQRLLPRVGGGRVPCVETLWPNTAVRSVLRSGDITKISTYLGKSSGNDSYRETLAALKAAGTISPEVWRDQMAHLPIG